VPTILLIEDDSAVAEHLGDLLKSEGFQVLHSADGEAGLARLEQSRPDLVLMDLLLPKIQGFDLLARIRANPVGEDLPIVVLSGVFKSRTYEDDLKKRFDVVAHLDKPLNNDALIDVLHDVFSSAYPEPTNGPGSDRPGLPELEQMPRDLTLADAPGVVPFKGDLAQVSFARLLGTLFQARVNGALMLRKGSVKKIVHFQNGVPVFVKSNLLSECLGQVMVNERLITQEECDDSLSRKKDNPGARQGEILVKMGSISPHNLQYALELQLLAKLYDLFSWLEGKYQFNSKAEYPGPQVVLELGPVALIYEGASRCMSTDRIRRDLAFAEGMALVPSADPTFRYQALQMEPRAEPFLELIDGSKTMEDLLAQGLLEDSEATLLLLALISGGLLKVVDPFLPIAVAVPVVEDEVVVLSTGEIDAIAELAKVEVPLPPILEEALVTERPTRVAPPASAPPSRPPPPAPPAPPQELPPAVVAEPAELEAEVFEVPQPKPRPRLQPDPQGSVLPRTQSWASKKERTGDLPAPLPAAPTDAPALSHERRLEVRARLEAQMAKLSTQRPAPAERLATGLSVPNNPVKKPSRLAASALRVGIDLEKERRRTEEELAHRLAELEQLSYYELLGLPSSASTDQLRQAYQTESRKHDPERILPSGASQAARRSAEQIYLLYTRALHTLTQAEARALYDLRNGFVERPRPAAPLVAGQIAEAGMAALATQDWQLARDAFLEASRLDPIDPLYAAHLAWATFKLAPEDGSLVEKVIDTLQRAKERCPTHYQVHLYAGLVLQKAGQREEAVRCLEQTLRLNPDCPSASLALKELEPKPTKKPGLLSRLTLGGG
jgi:CheY-like chemotaxis protein